MGQPGGPHLNWPLKTRRRAHSLNPILVLTDYPSARRLSSRISPNSTGRKHMRHYHHVGIPTTEPECAGTNSREGWGQTGRSPVFWDAENVVPSLTGLGSDIASLPRTCVLGYLLSPLRGLIPWKRRLRGLIRGALFLVLISCLYFLSPPACLPVASCGL